MKDLSTKLRIALNKFSKECGFKFEVGTVSKAGKVTIEFYEDVETNDVDISALDKSRFELADRKFNLKSLGIKLGTKIKEIEKSQIKSLKKDIVEWEVVGANPNARTKVIEVINDETGRRKFMTIDDIQYRLAVPASYEELMIARGEWSYSDDGTIEKVKSNEELYWDYMDSLKEE